MVIDCANGAGYKVAPEALWELGAEVIKIGVDPNGLNINRDCGSTAPEDLIRKVSEVRADIGIALDGDGDRLVMVDRDGRVYHGDELLYVIAMDAKRRDALGGGVVGTVMSNLGFEQALARANVPLARAKVGDRYVLELLREKGWILGGENSGHLLCLDKHTTGDGIVSALQVLAALRQAKQTLAQATADLVMYPQVLVNVQVPKGFEWQKDRAIADAQAQAEKSLNGKGRVLLRPSGTEPLLRVMVEGEPRQVVEQAANSIAAAVKRAAAG